MAPGGFVIAPAVGGGGTGSRLKLTLKGNSNSLDGTFTLKTTNLFNPVVYTSPVGNEKITLPRTWKSAELPEHLYVAANSFSSSSTAQAATLTLTYKQTLLAGPSDFQLEDSLRVSLLPVDLDIVHPATGELDEAKQHDSTKGGYVPVRRDDGTPVTKLVIRQGGGVEGMKYKVKFNEADKFKLWRDEARTQAVVSEQTEFDPAQETTLYFEGLKKSASVGAETITLQAIITGTVTDAETIHATVVEAEFDVWLNMFIPPQWGDLPALHPIHHDIVGWTPTNPPVPITVFRPKIFGGDDRSFSDVFLDNPASDVDDALKGTASRAHSQVVIIPFKDLDADGIKDTTATSAIGESHNYLKSASVPDPNAGNSPTNRLLPPGVRVVTHAGRAPTTGMNIDGATRYGTDGNAVKFKFHGSADNPVVIPSASIDWDFEIAISVNNTNVLEPKWILLGHLQDGFPAYEIYVRDSDGNGGDNKGTPIYQYDPIPLGKTPEDLFPIIGDETVLSANGTIP